ncbi:MAG: choice-of-anchor Q domain-containing protein [Candidatus Tenebribacter mawsonii]|nr:choice-of-anchor Q domain-containing protein [Candidatus Tenebribacter mawsonii]
MKLKFILLFVLICVNSWLHSVTYHIKQDGTGNFTTIQEGIIAATNSDTVLVYPETYFENIDYLEKSLTVASLYIITPADSLINQTIIDGNQQFRCVTINNCGNIELVGFTIQNGLATEGNQQSHYGGGIYLSNTQNAIISNCKIMNNKAFSGGGLYINQGNILLENNTISYNWGLSLGGAFYINGLSTSLLFSSEHYNDIYLNHAGTGADFAATNISNPIEVIVDTFTIMCPDFFFITPSQYFIFSALNAKIEQIDQNLYVAPDGDDNNNGLTEDDPLQTIAWAQTLIKRNDANPNTIHLASGVYSPSLNNQKYPLNIKQNVPIQGTTQDETILDAEEQTSFFVFYSKENIYPKLTLQNLTLRNGRTLPYTSTGAIYMYYGADILLEYITISNCFGDFASAILAKDGYYHFNNSMIKENSGGRALYLSTNYENQNPFLNVQFENVIIHNNFPGIGNDDGSGGGAYIGGHSEIPEDYYAKLVNCEISSNYNNSYGGSAGVYLSYLNADIVNCTFGNNLVNDAFGCVITANNSHLNLYNNIVYNNDGHSFNLWDDSEINIQNSLIEDSTSNIGYFGNGNGIVNWLEGNLDENPMFDSLGTYPFALLENSSCINAGTLDLSPGIELPEFDLAGNPRINGESIDMGAYEFQGDPQSNDENVINIPKITQVSNYPNPFNPSTTINLELAESGKIELAIYNIKGQKVKTLLDAYSSKGHFKIVWRGVDNNKKKLASGQYFIKLTVNGKEQAVSKCVLLK